MMKKLLARYLDLKLRTKLLLSYAAVILLGLALTLMFHYHISSSFLRQAAAFSQKSVAQSSRQMAFAMDAVEQDLYYKSGASPFINQQLNPEARGTPSVNDKLKYQAAAEYLLNSQPYYEFIFYADCNGTWVSTGKPRFDLSASGYAGPLDPAALEEEAAVLKNLWGDCQWAPLDEEVVLVKRAVYNTKTLQYLGYLVAGISTQSIRDIYAEIMPDGGGFTVFDAGGVPLLYDSPESRALCVSYREEVLTGGAPDTPDFNLLLDPYVSGLLQTPDKKYSIVYLYPTAVQVRDFFHLVKWNLFISSLAFCLAGAFAVLISGNISKNIRLLLAQVKRISQGNFDSRAALTSRDEIGELAQQFNRMSAHIHTLIQEISAQQVKKQQIEYQLLEQRYSALQAQLNPHFLYNVLESISSMAKIKNAPEVSQMICVLSGLLRDSINQKAKLIPLRREVGYLRNYTALYETMYGPALRFVFDVPAALEEVLVPNFLLQPLVENAILHGISQRADGGTMVLRAFRHEESLGIEIADDGPGMPPQTLQRLLEPQPGTPAEGDRVHIGVQSVQSRIQLLFGPAYGLRAASGPGGTTVTLRLPLDAETYVRETPPQEPLTAL